MWKEPWQLKVNILVSSTQFLLHSQSMNEDHHLCPPPFLSNLSSNGLSVDHSNDVGADMGRQQGPSVTARERRGNPRAVTLCPTHCPISYLSFAVCNM